MTTSAMEFGQETINVVLNETGQFARFNAAGTALVVQEGTYPIRKQQPNTFIPFGDSRVANGALDGTTYGNPYDAARCPLCVLQAMLAGRLVQVRNAGVAGNTSALMLARVQADVIDYAPGWCLMMGPINDIKDGVAHATTIANVAAIHAKLKANGIKFATSTIGGASAINTAAMKAARNQYNAWLKAYCAENGIPCADEFAATCDSAGAPLTNVNFDTIHYSDLGSGMAARAWYAVMDPVLPNTDHEQWNPGSLDYDNLVYNGAGGWTVTGALPTGWSGTTSNAGTPTYATVARSDWRQSTMMETTGTAAAQAAIIGVVRAASDAINQNWAASTAYALGIRRIANDGNQYLVTTAGTTDSSQPTWNATIGATTTDGTVTWTRVENFAVGDEVYAEVEYEVADISGGNLGFRPQCVIQAQGVSANVVMMAVNDQATRVPPHYDVTRGVLRSRPFTIPTGCTGYITYVRAYMDNGVTATLRVGRVGIYHVV